MQERTKLIVWLYSLKQVNKLKHYGLIHHVSKKMKYVIMYVNADKAEHTIKDLNKLAFVRKIDKITDKVIDDNFEEVFDKLLESQDKSNNEGVES